MENFLTSYLPEFYKKKNTFEVHPSQATKKEVRKDL